jgi:hypothetical protein
MLAIVVRCLPLWIYCAVLEQLRFVINTLLWFVHQLILYGSMMSVVSNSIHVFGWIVLVSTAFALRFALNRTGEHF